MAERRSSLVLSSRRVGLNSRSPVRPLLSQVNGKAVQPDRARKVEATSSTTKGDSGPSYDPITAPPESSDTETGSPPSKKATPNESDDSDEHYNRKRTADIRVTAFPKAPSSTARSIRSQPSKPKIRPPKEYTKKKPKADTEQPSGSQGTKRSAEEELPREPNQLERELEGPRQKKKKQPVAKYGSQHKNKKFNASQSTLASGERPTSSSSDDGTAGSYAGDSFLRVKSISPLASRSPQKSFKAGVRGFDLDSDLDTPEGSKPTFQNIPRHSSSPIPRSEKRHLGHLGLVDNYAVGGKLKSHDPTSKGPRSGNKQKGSKGDKRASEPLQEESPQAPVFTMPGSEDFDSFDESGSLDALTTPGISQDMVWDHSDIEETQTLTVPRCPMCNQEVDTELLKKYSVDGKMSVKQQTAFCRLHKRQSAVTAGTNKGYPSIDWKTLHHRCSKHRRFLQDILEGTRTSYYRKVFKERVDSGKNRTLLTSHDNLTPGYYGPRGLRVMTEFIMAALSDVVRRRAVEDRLISARSYTGFVQAVLVPELAVRLIIEDMSVIEERAREILEESIEIGELLNEETRDVVTIDENENDAPLKI